MGTGLMRKEIKRGAALLISVCVLALLSAIATSCAILSMSEYKLASNFRDNAKALYAAQAGIALAIARMREIAGADFNAMPLNEWAYPDAANPSLDAYDGVAGNGASGILSGGRVPASFALRISDSAGRININDPNAKLRDILGNLAVAVGPPLSESDGRSIADNRPAAGYVTAEEIMVYSPIDRAKFDAIKNHITVAGYVDANSDDSVRGEPYMPKSPVNINTASAQVLRAVLSGIITGEKAESLAGAILAYRASSPFTGWAQFEGFIDTVSVAPPLDADDRQKIKDNANPNRVKPVGYTTDFCFHPGGWYLIESEGLAGNAKRKAVSLVRIYGVLNQTAKEHFQGIDGDTSPVAFKTNTLDSCPVETINSPNSWNSGSDYRMVPDSVKNGFWDNMDDTFSGDASMFYVEGRWMEASMSNRLSYFWFPRTDSNTIKDENSDGKNELVFIPQVVAPYNAPITVLGQQPTLSPELDWGKFAFRSTISDGISPYRKIQVTGYEYKQWDVMMNVSRHILGSDDTVRMKQEYGDPPAETTWAEMQTQVGPGNLMTGWLSNGYYVTNTSITVTLSDTDHYFYAYRQGGPPELQRYIHNTYTSNNTSGQVGWQAHGAMMTPTPMCWADNMRVIPQDGGYFESKQFVSPEGDVRWGTIGATVTLSQGADPDSEIAYFQTSVDGGASWTLPAPGILPGSAIMSPASPSIRFRANFTTLDTPSSGLGTEPYLSETIALEDVTITYLPEVRISYYREGGI